MIQQHFDPLIHHSDTGQLENQQFNREKNQGLKFFEFLQFLQFCHSTIQQHFDPIVPDSESGQIENQHFNSEKKITV